MEMNINSLAMVAKSGDEKAFSVLLTRMEGAIAKVVSKYAVGEGESYRDDYRAEAMFALYKCLSNYDEGKGAFIPYAQYEMNAQILDFIRNRQSTIKIGTSMLDNMRKVKKAIEEIRENGLD
ncbi:MAG: sigma factor, partial [Bullifex sp.]